MGRFDCAIVKHRRFVIGCGMTRDRAYFLLLNIGHFLVGEAIFSGLDSAIRRMRDVMDSARRDAFGEGAA